MTGIERNDRKPPHRLLDKEALARALRERSSAGRLSQQQMAARYHMYGLAAVVYTLLSWATLSQR